MICFYGLIGKEKIINCQKIQYAWELSFFYKIRSFSDGISNELIFNIDKFKADHNPKINIKLIFLNCVVFDFSIYNSFHVAEEN